MLNIVPISDTFALLKYFKLKKAFFFFNKIGIDHLLARAIGTSEGAALDLAVPGLIHSNTFNPLSTPAVIFEHRIGCKIRKQPGLPPTAKKGGGGLKCL